MGSELHDPTDVLRESGGRGKVALKLVVIDGPDFGRELSIHAGTFTIGKDARNDLVLTDGAVSRVHLTGAGLEDRVRLVDSGSRNGSFVEGVRFTEVEVGPGAMVRIGRTSMQVMVRSERAQSLEPSDRESFGKLVGTSVAMRQLFARLERVARGDADVLIRGETGTGKELCAEALHAESPRARRPFVVCDLAGVAPTLIESELFGHVKGAFTGATGDRAGVFEQANGGTVFLDEVGELPLELQPRLLRVLERREVKRVGGSGWQRLDVRVVAATHRNLREQVSRGQFREDLYHRLAVLELTLPPLRERREDVPFLVDALLRQMGLAPELVSASTRGMLTAYEWPGNVRELRNVVARVVNLGAEAVLPNGASVVAPPVAEDRSLIPFKEAKEALVDSFERDYLVQLVERCESNLSRAAREAQIDRVYLKRLLRKHGLMSRDDG